MLVLEILRFYCSCFFFFFFKQKTAYEMRISDWSSDVCSSDLPAHRRRGIGRQVEPRGIRSDARKDAVVAQRHTFDLRRAGKRGEDGVDNLGDGARRVRPSRAGVDMPVGRSAAQIMDEKVVSRLLEVRRHARTHGTEPDEADAHVRSSPLSPFVRAGLARLGRSELRPYRWCGGPQRNPNPRAMMPRSTSRVPP